MNRCRLVQKQMRKMLLFTVDKDQLQNNVLSTSVTFPQNFDKIGLILY